MRVITCPDCGHRSAGMAVCPRCDAVLEREPEAAAPVVPPAGDRPGPVERLGAAVPAALRRRQATAGGRHATTVGLGRFVVLVGWLAFALGIATALAIIGSGFALLARAGVAIVLPAVVLPIGGLLLVIAGQLIQMAVEIARRTDEMVALMRAEERGGRPDADRAA